MVDSQDDAALRMFGGATFTGDAKLILPSGKVLGADEAQAMTSLFGGDSYVRPFDDDNPLSSANDDWTGNPEVDRARLVARAH